MLWDKSIPKRLSVRSPPILSDLVHHSEPGRSISLGNAHKIETSKILLFANDWQELQLQRIINLLLGVEIIRFKMKGGGILNALLLFRRSLRKANETKHLPLSYLSSINN